MDVLECGRPKACAMVDGPRIEGRHTHSAKNALSCPLLLLLLKKLKPCLSQAPRQQRGAAARQRRRLMSLLLLLLNISRVYRRSCVRQRGAAPRQRRCQPRRHPLPRPPPRDHTPPRRLKTVRHLKGLNELAAWSRSWSGSACSSACWLQRPARAQRDPAAAAPLMMGSTASLAVMCQPRVLCCLSLLNH